MSTLRRVAVWLDHPTATAPRAALARPADRSARPRSPLSLYRAVLARDSRPVDHPRAEGVRRCARRKRRCGPSRSRRRCRPDRCRSPRRAQQPALPVDSAGDPVRGRPISRCRLDRGTTSSRPQPQPDRAPPLALQAEHQHLHEQPVAAGPARSRAPPGVESDRMRRRLCRDRTSARQWRSLGRSRRGGQLGLERHRVAAEHGPEAAWTPSSRLRLRLMDPRAASAVPPATGR